MLILRPKVAFKAVILFNFLDNRVMTTPNRRILSFFFVQNEINEIKMTEDGISFLEDESKTQIKTPSN